MIRLDVAFWSESKGTTFDQSSEGAELRKSLEQRKALLNGDAIVTEFACNDRTLLKAFLDSEGDIRLQAEMPIASVVVRFHHS